MVTYKERLKPREGICKQFCADYPCDRTECKRRKMFDDKHVFMGEEIVCNTLDKRIKQFLYNEKREILDNNEFFRRRSLQ